MYKARYYKADGKAGKKRELPDHLFDGVVNEPAMHRAVKAYLANQRQGTGSAKTRSEVRGGSRKPWRQKGTGRARQGTIRAVQWEGGGVAFPPIPHSWRERLPKKVRSLARRSAFNARAGDDRVLLADLPDLDAPKTKAVVGMLGSLELGEHKVLVLTNGVNRNAYLSARNLRNVRLMPFGEESVYDILWAHSVVIEKAALDALEAPAEKKKEKAAAKPEVDEAAPKASKKAAAAEAAPAEEGTATEADEAPADDTPAADDASDGEEEE